MYEANSKEKTEVYYKKHVLPDCKGRNPRRAFLGKKLTVNSTTMSEKI